MKKKYRLIFILLLQSFYLNIYCETIKSNKNINLVDNNSEKKVFPFTSIKGNLFFTFGGLKNNKNESIHTTYENKFKIKTSFNKNDNILTIIESGNAFESPLNFDLQSKKGNNLKISTLLYQFKINDKYKGVIGPMMFGYNGLAGKSSLYNERIAILDGSKFTTSSGIGPGLGISRLFKKGLNASLKISSDNTIIRNETIHLISQIGLSRKNWGGTFTSNLNNKFNAYGIATYFAKGNFPSISTSLEIKNGQKLKTSYNWIFALQKKYKNKNFGLAFGTYNNQEKIAYEGWSEIDITDKLKIIPVFFVRETNKNNPELGFAINSKMIY
tara:strand:- start:14 stop:997 length:984 start_codon:yes stop_codon:yes gene_type:complete